MSETSGSKHLLAISIGPVQGFIAAARKTRDLWFGSYLLSEISKAAAKSVAATGGRLIFPGDADLKDVSVANVVLAEVGADPKSAAGKAKQAAVARWKEFANEAKQKVLELAGGQNVLREEHWNAQLDDFLELHVAWVPLGKYKESRDRLMRLLAGRKACRDFPPGHGAAGLPKSSLDGARETVLEKKLPETFRKNLHLRDGEQLDAVGVVKRFAERKKFPSLGEIAIGPLLRNPKYASTIIDEDLDDLDDDAKLRKFAEKSPYLAVLLADGDKMGKAISEQNTPEEHQKLSVALSTFAKNVPIIFKNHCGVCVYSGGDDVLGFLPLDTALTCARELHDDFAKQLSSYKDVSLSVGLVVGHYHEMLENLLEYSRKAEKAAKTATGDAPPFGDRNGLAVWTYHRSQGQRTYLPLFFSLRRDSHDQFD